MLNAMAVKINNPHTDEMHFVPEDEAASVDKAIVDPWRILVVDDDEDVHLITAIILKACKVLNRPLFFINAFSASEAKALLENCIYQPFDLLLLDVVMEDDDSGYQVARHLRKNLGNLSTKVLIRTGQPGVQSKTQNLDDVRIDGFYLKTELSAARLREVVTQALTT